MTSSSSIGTRLEQYTLKRPQEVLIVEAEIDVEGDRVSIFKGFSSSLMRATAFDPDIPVLPDGAIVQRIDRLRGPFDPDNPQYIEQNLTWEQMAKLLDELGV
jgi:hypothetical protein